MSKDELDIQKLISVAQELVADEHGRLAMAAASQAPVQEIEIDGHTYRLSVLLEYIPASVGEGGLESMSDALRGILPGLAGKACDDLADKVALLDAPTAIELADGFCRLCVVRTINIYGHDAKIIELPSTNILLNHEEFRQRLRHFFFNCGFGDQELSIVAHARRIHGYDDSKELPSP